MFNRGFAIKALSHFKIPCTVHNKCLLYFDIDKVSFPLLIVNHLVKLNGIGLYYFHEGLRKHSGLPNPKFGKKKINNASLLYIAFIWKSKKVPS